MKLGSRWATTSDAPSPSFWVQRVTSCPPLSAVPDNIIMKVLKQRLDQQDCVERGWVLHGFPRDLDQAHVMDSLGYKPNRSAARFPRAPGRVSAAPPGPCDSGPFAWSLPTVPRGRVPGHPHPTSRPVSPASRVRIAALPLTLLDLHVCL